MIYGGGPRAGTCRVDLEESSQFGSALLLGAVVGGWKIEFTGTEPDEAPYLKMTRELIAAFPRGGGEFVIEPDASSASYFVAANLAFESNPEKDTDSSRGVSGFKLANRLEFFHVFCPFQFYLAKELNLGDSIMTAIAIAPFASAQVEFTDLERLRVQESERVAGFRIELTKCGADVREEGGGREINGFSDGRKNARRGNRNLRRSPDGDVFWRSGIENSGD